MRAPARHRGRAACPRYYDACQNHYKHAVRALTIVHKPHTKKTHRQQKQNTPTHNTHTHKHTHIHTSSFGLNRVTFICENSSTGRVLHCMSIATGVRACACAGLDLGGGGGGERARGSDAGGNARRFLDGERGDTAVTLLTAPALVAAAAAAAKEVENSAANAERFRAKLGGAGKRLSVTIGGVSEPTSGCAACVLTTRRMILAGGGGGAAFVRACCCCSDCCEGRTSARGVTLDGFEVKTRDEAKS